METNMVYRDPAVMARLSPETRAMIEQLDRETYQYQAEHPETWLPVDTTPKPPEEQPFWKSAMNTVGDVTGGSAVVGGWQNMIDSGVTFDDLGRSIVGGEHRDVGQYLTGAFELPMGIAQVVPVTGLAARGLGAGVKAGSRVLPGFATAASRVPGASLVGKASRAGGPIDAWLASGARGGAPAKFSIKNPAPWLKSTAKSKDMILGSPGIGVMAGASFINSFAPAAAAEELPNNGTPVVTNTSAAQSAKPGKPGKDKDNGKGNHGGASGNAGGGTNRGSGAVAPSSSVVAAATGKSTKSGKPGVPAAIAAINQAYTAELAANAAANRATLSDARNAAATAQLGVQGVAADTYGGRAPAVLGQGMTGVRRDMSVANAQAAREKMDRDAALTRMYNEKRTAAYGDVANGMLTAAQARAQGAADIRKVGG